ncbi:MAG TPA: fucose isomerase [Paludibacteraceae bacterium]|nr:fucose isomerase [Paludibacteraceae bacterium]HQB69193.1 fucose isomerase [Paludibacteraceae bacterium]
MNKLNLITFASELNKQGSIRASHQELFTTLEKEYVVNIIEPKQLETLQTDDLQLVFISSGGVEFSFKSHYDKLPKPLFLLTDGLQNSLAASLEINTWARQQGEPCHIIHGNSETILKEIGDYQNLYRYKRQLHGKSVGVIGEPSAWLIASGVNYLEAKNRWGVEFVDILLDDVNHEFDKITNQEAENGADIFIKEAHHCKEPNRDDVIKAYRLYKVIRNICILHKLDAITIQCFGLIPTTGTTGCLALALLNDEGFIAGCEGDLQTLFTLMAVKAITGQTGFMCNPSQIDSTTNTMLIAHCTIGLKQTTEYTIRTHFESESGVAVQGTLPAGEFTLIKCGGNKLDEYFVSSAKLIENTDFNNVCRTQVRLQLDESVNYFLNNPIGNHHVLIHGNYAEQIDRFFHENQLTRMR